MPPGATMRYIKVNQGRNKNPSRGHNIVVNVSLKYIGRSSHQNKMAALGPKNANTAKPQHIVTPFFKININLQTQKNLALFGFFLDPFSISPALDFNFSPREVLASNESNRSQGDSNTKKDKKDSKEAT